MCGKRRGIAFVSTWLAVLAAELLAGCGSGAAPAFQQAHQVAGLEFSLASDQPAYATGQVIPLTLTVTNVTGSAITYTTTPPSAVTNAFVAVRAGQATYLCSGGNGGETQAAVEFDPHIPVAFTCGWAPVVLPGGVQNQPPGVYPIQAFLGPGTINGVTYTQQQAQAELAANPITITISSH